METCTQSSSGLLNFNLMSEISHLHACAYMWNVRYQQDSNQSTPPLHLFSLSETRTRPYECVYIHTHGRVHIFVVGLALRWASCWLGDMCNRKTSTSSPAGQQFARGRYIKSDNAWCSVIIHRSHIHTWHISICMPFVQSVSSADRRSWWNGYTYTASCTTFTKVVWPQERILQHSAATIPQ